MSVRPPDFDELVGELEESDRERLRRVHELLGSADPPPELGPRLTAPPPVAGVRAAWRRPPRAGRALALAAALALTVFALGVLVGDRIDEPGTFDEIELSGTASAPGASGSIEVFDLDDAGNWPMEISVLGLRPEAENQRYELWLTRDGEPAELCGSFLVGPEGTAVVPMNAPWRLDAFDGWLVVEEGSRVAVLST